MIIVVLERHLFDCHHLAGFIINGGVNLAEAALPDLDAPLPREGDLAQTPLDVDLGEAVAAGHDFADELVLAELLVEVGVEVLDGLQAAVFAGVVFARTKTDFRHSDKNDLILQNNEFSAFFRSSEF